MGEWGRIGHGYALALNVKAIVGPVANTYISLLGESMAQCLAVS